MKPKTRVAYEKGMRASAKERREGLVTISVTTPDGERYEEQKVATVDECRFARWAMALLFCDEVVRRLPDLQGTIRRLMNG